MNLKPTNEISQEEEIANEIIQVEEEQRDRTAENAEVSNPAITLDSVLKKEEGVSNYLKKLWMDAANAKKPIDTEGLLSLNQRNGKYESIPAAAIAKTGGSDNYHGMTGEKCRILEVLIRDVILENDNFFYDLIPTPMPELSGGDKGEALLNATNLAKDIENQFGPETVQQPNVGKAIVKAGSLMTRLKTEKIAKEKAKKIKRKIDDQLIEGGAINALAEFISDFSTYQSACMVGPLIKTKRKLIWENNEPKEEVDTYFSIERVSPFDVYPEPGINNIQNGYVFLRREVSKKDIADLRFIEGYSKENIEEALDAIGETHGVSSVDEDGFGSEDYKRQEQKTGENRNDTTNETDKKMYITTYWGTLSGRQLKELEVKAEDGEEFDKYKEYDIWCEILNNRIIRCAMNPHPLGLKPIHMSGAYKIPGSLWHDSLPKIIRPYQKTCNTCLRAMQNNVAFAHRPLLEINKEKVLDGFNLQNIVPGAMIPVSYSHSNANTSNVVKPINIPMHGNEISQILNQEMILADNACGIPRLAYGGNTNGTGAGRTASGMSMMMQSSSKSIKQMIKNLDFDIVKPIIDMMYHLNVLYSDDFESIGDITIQPLGSTEVIAKEADTSKLLQFYQIVASNPQNVQILGEKGYRTLISAIANQLNISEEIIPSETLIELQNIIQKLTPPPPEMPPQAGGQKGANPQGVPTQTPNQPNGSPRGGPVA